MRAIFDANFLTHSSSFKDDCSFLLLAKEQILEECYVFLSQYQKANCSHTSPPCIDLDSVIDQEDVAEFMINTPKNVSLNNIYSKSTNRDIFDVMSVYYAYYNDCCIFCCDKNILKVCKSLEICRYCFKSVVKEVAEKLGVANFLNMNFDISMLTNNDNQNPFISLRKSSRCYMCSDNPCDFEAFSEELRR